RRPASTTRPARSMRSTPFAPRGCCAAPCSPAGAFSAATRGAGEGTTPSRDAPAPLLSADAARARGASRPQLAARDDRPPVGVVDRRVDGDRPDAARAVDGQADPLDAEPAALRAADEGDPEEIQGRQEAAERRADEVLPREQRQPGGVVPADARAV